MKLLGYRHTTSPQVRMHRHMLHPRQAGTHPTPPLVSALPFTLYRLE